MQRIGNIMADGVTIQLSGINDIIRALRKLSDKVEKKIARKAVRAGTKLIAAEIKTRAPQDTGILKRSVSVRAARRRRRGVISMNAIFNMRKYPQLVSFSAGSRTNLSSRKFEGKRYFYPAALEYGTSKMKARPFVRPAWDSKKNQALAVVLGGIREGIEREASK